MRDLDHLVHAGAKNTEKDISYIHTRTQAKIQIKYLITTQRTTFLT
jgi:hypothetical protein